MEYVAQVLPSLGESSVVQSAVDRLPGPRRRPRAGTESRGCRAPEGRHAHGGDRAACGHRPRARARPRTSTVDRRTHAVIALPAERDRADRRATRGARPHVPRRARGVPTRARRARAGASRRARAACSAPARPPPRSRWRSPAPGGVLDRIWPTVTAPAGRPRSAGQRAAAGAAAGAIAHRRGARRCCSAIAGRLDPRRSRGRRRTCRCSTRPTPLVRGVTSSYGYVLADEAQDLSPMQLRMVLAAFDRRPRDAGRRHRSGDRPEPLRRLAGAARRHRLRHRAAHRRAGHRLPRAAADHGARRRRCSRGSLRTRSSPRAVRRGPGGAAASSGRRRSTSAAALVDEVDARVDGRADRRRHRAGRASSRTCAARSPQPGMRRRRHPDRRPRAPGDGAVRRAGEGPRVRSRRRRGPAAIAGADEDWAYVYIALTRATRTLSVLHTHAGAVRAAGREPQPEPRTRSRVATCSERSSRARGGTELSARYTEALMHAKFLHAGQRRRARRPYLAHLQAVAALVLEDGGSEDEAIAALLHDAVEDHGADVLDRIAAQFGVAVARIVPAAPIPRRSPARPGASASSSTCASSRAPGPRCGGWRSPRSSTTRARCCATTGASATGSGRGWTSIPRTCSGTRRRSPTCS